MIEYRYKEEELVALAYARAMKDKIAEKILLSGEVTNKEEAIHLSKFFWAMVDRASIEEIEIPCDGSSEYWLEKLYNSLGGYLENIGYESEWDAEIDRA